MMTKTMTRIALLLCFFTTALSAQKVDLDPWRFQPHYQHLPAAPLDSTYKTFNVVVSAAGSISSNFSPTQLTDMVGISGMKRVDGQGHITVTATLGNIELVEAKVSERVAETKDKDGKVTGKLYYYTPTIKYRFSTYVDVKDYKGKAITTINRLAPYDNSWAGTETSSSKEATDYLNANQLKLRDQFARERTTEALAKLTSYLGDDYGFYPTVSNELVYLLDSKKHPEHEGHQKVVRFVKDVLGKEMKENMPLDSIKAHFQPLKEYLEGTVKTYDKDEKGDRKMRYAAYFTLSKISYWLDDPEASIKYAEALIANKYDEKDGKKLIEAATALQTLFKKNNIYTRHFTIDVLKYEAPKIAK